MCHNSDDVVVADSSRTKCDTIIYWDYNISFLPDRYNTMDGPMVVAIIPIKHHSQRLPGKNFRMVGGKPLYRWILETLVNTQSIKRVIIDTDSPIILNNKELNLLSPCKIRILERAQTLRGPTVSTNTIIKHIINDLTSSELGLIGMTQEQLKTCTFIQTHVTNPCLTSHTIDSALKQFRKSPCTSLFSVTQHRARYWRQGASGLSALNHDPCELVPTQDLLPLYEDNSCFYIFDWGGFMESENRITNEPDIYVMNDHRESYDIDYEEDLQIAELCLRARMQEQGAPPQSCLITGSAGGLGSSLVRHFSAESWEVYETDQKLVKQENLFSCDLEHEKDIGQLVEWLNGTLKDTVSSDGKRLDALILNAAYQECHSLCETPKVVWDKTMAINVTANYLLIKGLLEADLLGPGSRIVLIGSVHSQCTSSGIAAYSISKAALVNMTRTLALELGPKGITVNCLHPGAIKTPMLMDSLGRNGVDPEQALAEMADKHPSGRVAEPDDICKAVMFLATSQSSAFNGSNLIADGGVHIHLATE